MESKNIAIENILADRRGRSELDRDIRINHYHQTYPELKALDQAIKVCRAELLLQSLEQAGEPLDKSELALLEERRVQYLRLNQIEANYDQIIPVCSYCQDSGYVGGAFCSCYQELLRPLVLKQAGLDLYDNVSFSRSSNEFYSDASAMAKIKAVCEAYAAGFPGQSRSLLFAGNPGTGKTYMAVCIARAVADKTVPTLFVRIADLMETMNTYRMQMLSFSPDADRLAQTRARRELILHGGFLVIDELGIEAKGPNTISDLLEILGTRKQLHLPTVITTNLSVKELQKTYDNRLYSRLFGDFMAFHFPGEDIRMSSKYRNQ